MVYETVKVAIAVGIFIGGLVYAPLCLIEMRLSPQLHRWIYGYMANAFAHSVRGEGYKPTVTPGGRGAISGGAISAIRSPPLRWWRAG